MTMKKKGQYAIHHCATIVDERPNCCECVAAAGHVKKYWQ
jgi:hypothetical protein